MDTWVTWSYLLARSCILHESLGCHQAQGGALPYSTYSIAGEERCHECLRLGQASGPQFPHQWLQPAPRRQQEALLLSSLSVLSPLAAETALLHRGVTSVTDLAWDRIASKEFQSPGDGPILHTRNVSLFSAQPVAKMDMSWDIFRRIHCLLESSRVL